MIDKHDRFVRISEYRLERLLLELDRMERFGSRNYEYSEIEALSLIYAVERKVERFRSALLSRFRRPVYRSAA